MKTEKPPLKVREIQVVYSADKTLASRDKITCSKSAYDYLLNGYNEKTLAVQEQFVVMLLNNSNKPLGVYKASAGGLTSTVVDIRLIIATALKSLATGIILSHNHPSTNLNPSDADIQLTRKLKEACKLLDISLLDHIIISPLGEYKSLADEGML